MINGAVLEVIDSPESLDSSKTLQSTEMTDSSIDASDRRQLVTPTIDVSQSPEMLLKYETVLPYVLAQVLSF